MMLKTFFNQYEELMKLTANLNSDLTHIPYYNIIRKSSLADNGHIIEIALPGFTEEDIDVSKKDNRVSIHAKRSDAGERPYVYRGINKNHYAVSFVVPDNSIVDDVTLEDGILKILISYATDKAKEESIPINSKKDKKKTFIQD